MPIAERINRYLAACPDSIAGQHGDATTYRIACQLVWAFALNETDTLHYLRLYTDTRCRPPWTDAQLKAKVRQAFRRHKHVPRGSFLGEH